MRLIAIIILGFGIKLLLPYRRPVKCAYKQKPEQIEKWMSEEYPTIKEIAKAENGEIFWGDETGTQNESNYAKGCAPIGQTPVLKIEKSERSFMKKLQLDKTHVKSYFIHNTSFSYCLTSASHFSPCGTPCLRQK